MDLVAGEADVEEASYTGEDPISPPCFGMGWAWGRTALPPELLCLGEKEEREKERNKRGCEVLFVRINAMGVKLTTCFTVAGFP